jgi:hypothetical protein
VKVQQRLFGKEQAALRQQRFAAQREASERQLMAPPVK